MHSTIQELQEIYKSIFSRYEPHYVKKRFGRDVGGEIVWDKWIEDAACASESRFPTQCPYIEVVPRKPVSVPENIFQDYKAMLIKWFPVSASVALAQATYNNPIIYLTPEMQCLQRYRLWCYWRYTWEKPVICVLMLLLHKYGYGCGTTQLLASHMFTTSHGIGGTTTTPLPTITFKKQVELLKQDIIPSDDGEQTYLKFFPARYPSASDVHGRRLLAENNARCSKYLHMKPRALTREEAREILKMYRTEWYPKSAKGK